MKIYTTVVICFICFLIKNQDINSMNVSTTFKNFWPKVQAESISKDYRLDKNSTIEIDNLCGSIKIFGWNQESIEIQATKTGSEEKIKNTKININSTPSSIKVSTHVTTDHKPAQVDYIINVPEDAVLSKICTNKGDIEIADIFGKISASSMMGNIKIQNARDAIEARASTGNIDIKQKAITSKNSMLLETLQGDIKIYLPKNSHASLFAKTGYGEVTSDHPITLESKLTQLNKEAWSLQRKEAVGNLGDGGASITIDVNKGNISLIVTNNS